jgi:hypothetical protein
MKRMLFASILAASVLVVPGTASPANATPCNQGTFHDMWKSRVFVFDRINGEDSHWNKKDDGLPETVTLTYGRSESRSVTKHWEVEASVGYSWPTVKAEIKGKYGQSYVNSATTSRSWSKAITIKDGWTGWHRADFYRRVVFWRAYTWRWNADKAACVKRTVAKAYWGDPKVQYVSIKKKGHVYP